MSQYRRAVRRDENETSIVGALRQLGYRVWYHKELMDLLVCYETGPNQRAFGFLEVKVPGKENDTTPAQKKFLNDTFGAPRAVVTTAEQAITVVRGWQFRGVRE